MRAEPDRARTQFSTSPITRPSTNVRSSSFQVSDREHRAGSARLVFDTHPRRGLRPRANSKKRRADEERVECCRERLQVFEQTDEQARTLFTNSP